MIIEIDCVFIEMFYKNDDLSCYFENWRQYQKGFNQAREVNKICKLTMISKQEGCVRFLGNWKSVKDLLVILFKCLIWGKNYHTSYFTYKSSTILQNMYPLFEANIVFVLYTSLTFFFKNHTNQTYKNTTSCLPYVWGKFLFHPFLLFIQNSIEFKWGHDFSGMVAWGTANTTVFVAGCKTFYVIHTMKSVKV